MSSPTKSAVQDDPALREMEQLLEEWRLLTGAEKEAINAEDWDRLAILQQRKVSCQRLIEDAELRLGTEGGSSTERKEIVKKRLRPQTEALLGLEAGNRELLAGKIAQAKSQLKVSEKTMRSLKHIQRAYGTGSQSFWHSYS